MSDSGPIIAIRVLALATVEGFRTVNDQRFRAFSSYMRVIGALVGVVDYHVWYRLSTATGLRGAWSLSVRFPGLFMRAGEVNGLALYTTAQNVNCSLVQRLPAPRHEEATAIRVRHVLPARCAGRVNGLKCVSTFHFSLPASIGSGGRSFSFSYRHRDATKVLNVCGVPIDPKRITRLPILRRREAKDRRDTFFRDAYLFVLLTPKGRFRPTFLCRCDSVKRYYRGPNENDVCRRPILARVTSKVSNFRVGVKTVSNHRHAYVPNNCANLLLKVISRRVRTMTLQKCFGGERFLEGSVREARCYLFVGRPFLRKLDLPVNEGSNGEINDDLHRYYGRTTARGRYRRCFLFRVSKVNLGWFVTTSLGQRIRVVRRLFGLCAFAIIMLMSRDDASALRGRLHNAIRNGKRAIALRRYPNSSANGHVPHSKVVNQRMEAHGLPMTIAIPIVNVRKHLVLVVPCKRANGGRRFKAAVKGLTGM